MKFVIVSIILVFIGLSESAVAQVYTWNGDAGTNDFFDENNWGSSIDGAAPGNGEIDPSKPIEIDLVLMGTAIADGIIQLGSGSLEVNDGELSATDITGGNLEMGNHAYLYLSGAISILENTNISFTSALSWIQAPHVRPGTIHDQVIGRIKYKQLAVSYPETIRLDNYYAGGTLIRPNDVKAKPLQLYSLASLSGTSSGIETNRIYSGNEIPEGLNNNISSFRLKRGYMATMAVEPDGTGKSNVFVASEKDLVVEELTGMLSNDISFIRVIPWNWVTKRGTGGDIDGMENTWYYRWSNSDFSDLQREYAPMAWGHSNADDEGDIQNFRSKNKVTHVMGFNEPDHCGGQSGQYGDLCIPDTAVILYKNLMKTGLRMVSPGCREGAWNDWLHDFFLLATEKEIRMDVIAVHWYDWGGNPGNTPNADPQKVFNRFKNYLDKVYDLYGLPIWVTEFNANPSRTTWVQLEFMKLALPYLESLDYVERYCWFQPVSGTGDYYNENGFLTPVGEYYKTYTTNPSIPGAAWAGSNNISIINNNTEHVSVPGGIVLYPNPVKEMLYISTENKIREMRVYDLTGKEIIHAMPAANQMNVGKLTPGIYFIRIDGVTKKFIKN